ncbi:hypothetical protein EB796_006410 [Bugula neritina]|uniref:Uncharacterized protein n=1 Tax=Bugula neritina TaxID=10212 RepID=A0A7J7KAP6_BUGNE|nr:hypothetical protein EB796_006410 [Bugula neritina]
MGRDTMSSFHTAVASQDDLYSSDSARSITRKAMAVEKVRQKLLKMMMPANKRKHASRSHTPSVNTVSSVERLAQQPRPDDGKIGPKSSQGKIETGELLDSDVNEFIIPTCPSMKRN